MRIDDAIVAYLEPPQRAELAPALGIDWVALPGESDSRRAAALVTAAIRRGQWPALSAALAAHCPAVAWAELPTPLPTLHALHTDLCRRLSLDGLRTLCFQLGIDFDDLPGDSKAGRARELVLWLERAGRIGELSWEATRRVTPPKANRGLTPRHRLIKMWRKFLNRRPDRRKLENLPYTMPLLALLAAALLIAADGRTLPAADHPVTPAPAVVALLNEPVATPAPSPTWVAWDWSNLAAPPTPAATPTMEAPVVAGLVTETAVPPAAVAYVIVGPRGANLRQGPGAAYAVVATLRAGAQLTVRAVSPTGEWYQVRLPGKGSPWIDAAHAVLGGGTGGLPVATAAHPTAQPTTTARPSPTSGRPLIPGAGPAATTTHRPLPPTPTRTPAAPPTPLPSPTIPPP